jgi:hypothetical protein
MERDSMDIQIDSSGTVSALERLVDKSVAGGSRSLLIFACDENGFTPETLDPLLREIPVSAFGGVFPALFHMREKMARGTIVVGIPREISAYVLSELSRESADFERPLEEILSHAPSSETMFVFADGFAKHIGALIEALFTVFGLELNYVGGGAGSLSMVQKPCLISNGGLLQDSAVLALSDLKSSVGVCHGWKSIEGPFQVTEAEDTVIKTLDWKPALSVYRKVVEAHAGQRIDQDGFFQVAKAYPFGISRLSSETIVRDPIKIGDNGEIMCVGEVPVGVLVDILHGDDSSLLEAAGRAYTLSADGFDGADERITLFIDCISRVLFLEERFYEELGRVNPTRGTLIGAATLGEIANTGNNVLEFYNKTAVVSLIER